MIPKTFPEQNTTFQAEGCLDLPAFVGENWIVTAWEVTDEDLEIMRKTKTIYMRVWGKGIQPCLLQTDLPFRDENSFEELDGIIEENES